MNYLVLNAEPWLYETVMFVLFFGQVHFLGFEMFSCVSMLSSSHRFQIRLRKWRRHRIQVTASSQSESMRTSS